MGSCAFLMPVGSARFLRANSYKPKAALGLAIGGVPAVLVAAFLVRSLPLDAVRWLVIVVVLYTSTTMLQSARQLQQVSFTNPLPPGHQYRIPRNCVCCMGPSDKPFVVADRLRVFFLKARPASLGFHICNPCARHVDSNNLIDKALGVAAIAGVIVGGSIFAADFHTAGELPFLAIGLPTIAYLTAQWLDGRNRRPGCSCFGDPVRVKSGGRRLVFAHAKYAELFLRLNEPFSTLKP